MSSGCQWPVPNIVSTCIIIKPVGVALCATAEPHYAPAAPRMCLRKFCAASFARELLQRQHTSSTGNIGLIRFVCAKIGFPCAKIGFLCARIRQTGLKICFLRCPFRLIFLNFLSRTEFISCMAAQSFVWRERSLHFRPQSTEKVLASQFQFALKISVIWILLVANTFDRCYRQADTCIYRNSYTDTKVDRLIDIILTESFSTFLDSLWIMEKRLAALTLDI